MYNNEKSNAKMFEMTKGGKAMVSKGALLVITAISVICLAIFVGATCIFYYGVGLSFGSAMLATIILSVGLLAVFLMFSLINFRKYDIGIDKNQNL